MKNFNSNGCRHSAFFFVESSVPLRKFFPAKGIILLIAILASTVQTGCLSAMIVGSGKMYSHLISSDTTVNDVRSSLGMPAWSEVYDPPLPIDKTPQYLERASYMDPWSPFVWDGHEEGSDNLAARCEIYTREGPYADMERGQAYGMIGALTFGVGDVLFLPYAVKERIEMSNCLYSLTFWYDEDGRFVGYYEGSLLDRHKGL